jgi:hypothetical protein
MVIGVVLLESVIKKSSSIVLKAAAVGWWSSAPSTNFNASIDKRLGKLVVHRLATCVRKKEVLVVQAENWVGSNSGTVT